MNTWFVVSWIIHAQTVALYIYNLFQKQRWRWNVEASLYLSSSLPSIRNLETTTAERTCCAPVSSAKFTLICSKLHEAARKCALDSAASLCGALIMTNMWCWIIHCLQSGLLLLSCIGSEDLSNCDAPQTHTFLRLCACVCIYRLVEVPISAATGVSGSGGVGSPDWVLCLPLPEPHPHSQHRSTSPAGW